MSHTTLHCFTLPCIPLARAVCGGPPSANQHLPWCKPAPCLQHHHGAITKRKPSSCNRLSWCCCLPAHPCPKQACSLFVTCPPVQLATTQPPRPRPTLTPSLSCHSSQSAPQCLHQSRAIPTPHNNASALHLLATPPPRHSSAPPRFAAQAPAAAAAGTSGTSFTAGAGVPNSRRKARTALAASVRLWRPLHPSSLAISSAICGDWGGRGQEGISSANGDDWGPGWGGRGLCGWVPNVDGM